MLAARSGNLKRNWHKDWNIGILGGVNLFATEIKKDFSRTSMDMNPSPNGSFSFHINKRFSFDLGLGFEFEKNYFSGDKTFPNNINWLIYSDRFNNETASFVPHPVYFRTNTSTYFLNLHYNFENFINSDDKKLNLNMYVKVGLGFSSIGVEMGYKDAAHYFESNLPNPLYEKGQGIHSFKDLYGTFQICPGVNYFLSARLSLNAELKLMFLSNDYLDGIQNYEATIRPNNGVLLNRQEVYAFIPSIKFGISYHFNWYKSKMNESLWGQPWEEYDNKFFNKTRKPSDRTPQEEM
ncbi:MAG: hypothetical protein JW798_01880 [Prolixibacteraceae bacterium]|nr:hypothetical protein [Prolixibacteraceae bacterium]